MSAFITRTAPVTRAIAIPFRTSSAAACRPALFSTSARRQEKGPIEATKETLRKADRLVSDAALKGIETGKMASHKIKDAIGIKSKKVEGEAKKVARDVEDKAGSLKDEAEDKAAYLKEKAKEEAEEWTGKA
ncbi:hypothetical protein PABG_02241 [Paracoccidioides brasiliensis Pb03]|nr:hypothetical protein PABG_02241 [Paracoccidioides brasiliensis Pb03]